MLCKIRAGFRENGGFELGILTPRCFLGELSEQIVKTLGDLGIQVISREDKASCYRLDILNLPKIYQDDNRPQIMMTVADIVTADIAHRNLDPKLKTLRETEELFAPSETCRI